MRTKTKNPKRIKVVNVLVKYNLNKVDFEIFSDIYDAEKQKQLMEYKGFICHICRKQIR